MGADGGVCWMELRKPARYARLIELLRPFYFLTESSEADWQAEASEAFLDANDYYAPGYIVGRYGSFQDFSIYEDLERVLGDTPDDVCLDSALTFTELVEDLATRPLVPWDGGPTIYMADRSVHGRAALNRMLTEPHSCRRVTVLEAMLWDAVGIYVGDADKCANRLGAIAPMTILDWHDEVCSILSGRAGHAETWT